MKDSEIRVVELFAGVGGFRLGLEKSSHRFKTVWANQWEPNKKSQYAFDCYTTHFGISDNHVNEDISRVKDSVPNHQLLVGGFPCQDYSVARTQAKGITGQKGVLSWEINHILTEKRPPFVLLENVDRLIKSPGVQRGRDFGVMLRCLSDLGYSVEWRVINAADYGMAQRRRRVFIFAFHESTNYHSVLEGEKMREWLHTHGFFASQFPLDMNYISKHKPIVTAIDKSIFKDLAEVSDSFKLCFYNSGLLFKGMIYSEDFKPIDMDSVKIGDIMHKEPVDEKYFINGDTKKWEYLKGSKSEPRVRPNGGEYRYEEGSMAFPDPLDRPARTILTSESKVNRSTHVVEDYVTKRLRLLTPVECERLNGFDDGWTDTGMPESYRYFTMGNALVVPLIEKMGKSLCGII